MKIERTVIETVCDHCRSKYSVLTCSVCGAEMCSNHYMILKEHDIRDGACTSFVMCFKCIPSEIMRKYIDIMRNNFGNQKWGEEWLK